MSSAYGGRSRPTDSTVQRIVCDGRSMSDADQGPERHINIHFSPEIMGGTYANFANVSFSDYEFTITFARVDHEVEEEEIPGVVVSRVNLSHRFAQELSDALEDALSKWDARGHQEPARARRRRPPRRLT